MMGTREMPRIDRIKNQESLILRISRDIPRARCREEVLCGRIFLGGLTSSKMAKHIFCEYGLLAVLSSSGMAKKFFEEILKKGLRRRFGG